MLSGCLACCVSHTRIQRSHTLLLVPLCHLRIFFFTLQSYSLEQSFLLLLYEVNVFPSLKHFFCVYNSVRNFSPNLEVCVLEYEGGLNVPELRLCQWVMHSQS